MLRLPLDRNQHVVIYDGVDSHNKGSEEAASAFMAWLDDLKKQPDAVEEESDCSEESSEEDTVTLRIQLQLHLDQLLIEFPAHGFIIKAAAYQAGIYETKYSQAYDPGMNNFFRHNDSVPTDKVPAEIAAFIDVLRVYTQKSGAETTPSFSP